MIKKLLILFLILMQIGCNSENKLLEKEWILIHRKDIKTGEIDYWGLRERFRFKENELTINFLTIKSGTVRNYKLENSKINLDTITGKVHHYKNDSFFLERKNDMASWGEIIEITNDSLVIKHDSKSLSVYRPMKETNLSAENARKLYNRLLENTWEIIGKEDTIRIYCTSEEHGGMFAGMDWIQDISYEDTRINKFSGFAEICSGEYWTIDYFDGKILLIYSYGQTENQLLQITEITENEIRGELIHYFSLGDWESVKITQVNPTNKLKQLSKEDFIGNWSSKNLNNKKNSKSMFISEDKMDTINIDLPYENTNFITERALMFNKKRITLSDLKNENLIFNFQPNGKYEIKAGKKIIRKGNNWNITKDKRYLYLDAPVNSDNFTKIISFEENILKLEKWELINVELENPNYCVFTNLKLKLIKE